MRQPGLAHLALIHRLAPKRSAHMRTTDVILVATSPCTKRARYHKYGSATLAAWPKERSFGLLSNNKSTSSALFRRTRLFGTHDAVLLLAKLALASAWCRANQLQQVSRRRVMPNYENRHERPVQPLFWARLGHNDDRTESVRHF